MTKMNFNWKNITDAVSKFELLHSGDKITNYDANLLLRLLAHCAIFCLRNAVEICVFVFKLYCVYLLCWGKFNIWRGKYSEKFLCKGLIAVGRRLRIKTPFSRLSCQAGMGMVHSLTEIKTRRLNRQ